MAKRISLEEVCDLVLENSDNEGEEYAFSGSEDELDAEVVNFEETCDVDVGANIVISESEDDDSDTENERLDEEIGSTVVNRVIRNRRDVGRRECRNLQWKDEPSNIDVYPFCSEAGPTISLTHSNILSILYLSCHRSHRIRK